MSFSESALTEDNSAAYSKTALELKVGTLSIIAQMDFKYIVC